jgi:hypothetical protein
VRTENKAKNRGQRVENTSNDEPSAILLCLRSHIRTIDVINPESFQTNYRVLGTPKTFIYRVSQLRLSSLINQLFLSGFL